MSAQEETIHSPLEITFSPLDGEDEKLDDNPEAAEHVGITFGVELEFSLAALYAYEVDDPDPGDSRNVYNIISEDTVYETGLYRRMHEKQDVYTHIRNAIINRLGSSERAKIIVDQQRYYNPLSVWFIEDDSSIRTPYIEENTPREAYTFVSTEVKSPAFHYSEASLLEVQTICHLLTTTYRIVAAENRFAGLHVHVGFSKNGYTLPELQNLCSIWWVFEPLFYKLVIKSRETNEYCRQVRINSRLAHSLRRENKTVRHGLDQILENNKASSLVRLLSPSDSGNRLGFNVSNLDYSPRPFGSKQTIEFRIHEATLDPEEIKSWIQFCTNLVMFATVVKSDRLHVWLRMYVNEDYEREGAYSVIELLHAMKMPALAGHFAKKLERMKAEGLDRADHED